MKLETKFISKIFSFNITNFLPVQNLLNCNPKNNCLNIKLGFNAYDSIYFLLIPYQKLILFQPQVFAYTSDFKSFGFSKLNFIKFTMGKQILVASNIMAKSVNQNYVDISVIHYEIQNKKYITENGQLNYYQKTNKRTSISRILTNNLKGLFRDQTKNQLFNMIVSIDNKEHNDIVISLIFQNKRIVCYKIMRDNQSEFLMFLEELSDYISMNLKTLVVLLISFLTWKFLRLIKNYKK